MKEMKFEEALGRLEKIVGGLERGDLSLEESLAKYEEGVKLVGLCQKKLGEARKRIEVLVKTKDGKVRLEPLEGEASKKRQKAYPERRVGGVPGGINDDK